MKPIHALMVPGFAAILVTGDASGVAAYVGMDPILVTGIASCTYTSIQARIGPDKSVSYKVQGSCSGSAVSGEMAYRDGKFHERFIVRDAEISTLGYCDTDPWSTAVNCHDQKVASTGVKFDPGLMERAPLSLISGENKAFRRAFLDASRPNPPGIPVNFTATSDFGQVVARWLAPDTSGDRPFLGFLLQARPQNAAAAGWIDLARVARQAQPDYRLSAKLPPRSAAISAWDVRLCSTTALTESCTPPLAPESVLVRETFDARAKSNSVPPLQAPVRAVGRVKGAQPSGPPLPICDAAAAARDRNSPAAAGLKAQCLALGGRLPDRSTDETPNWDELAAKGEVLANGNLVSTALRDQQPEGPIRRGFDIGMAVTDGHTEWGPGKQKMLESLRPAEQEGFKVATSFSLDRNRNLELAETGAAIADTDASVAKARTRESDARYWLGFDIATGIFGDPAGGARGNTATGPGSLGIRDALSAPAQRGFNASVALHLSRRY